MLLLSLMLSVLPHEEANTQLKDKSSTPIVKHVTCPIQTPRPIRKQYVPRPDVPTPYKILRKTSQNQE
jgi:hypothetical protein